MTGPLLRYRPAPDAPWQVVEFPPDTDPFALLAEVEARMFPKQAGAR